MDTDGNGAITLPEAEAVGAERLIKNFNEIDRYGSGDLTREEMQAQRGERKQAL